MDGRSFFSFKDFLTAEEQVAFFDWSHAEQVAKVTQYLDFLALQPASASFTSSNRASRSWAEVRQTSRVLPDGLVDLPAAAAAPPPPQQQQQQPTITITIRQQPVLDDLDTNVMMQLVDGMTQSGFGAFGTAEPGVLNQKQLSLAVANLIEPIGHKYKVETSKKAKATADVKPVLNSRSFFFYWCHAEKQKLVDVRQKLQQAFGSDGQNPPQQDQIADHWRRIRIVVDRAMCEDCIEFAKCLAVHDHVDICIQDPQRVRVFPRTPGEAIKESDVE